MLLVYYNTRGSNLSLGEIEGDGDLVAAESGEIVVRHEVSFQLADLLLRERRSLLARLRRRRRRRCRRGRFGRLTQRCCVDVHFTRPLPSAARRSLSTRPRAFLVRIPPCNREQNYRPYNSQFIRLS